MVSGKMDAVGTSEYDQASSGVTPQPDSESVP
jgi:hypothetical protein